MNALLAHRPSGRGRVAACALVLSILLTQGVAAAERSSTHDVKSTWREQGLEGYDGIVWFRSTVKVSPDDGILLGPPAYGGYEAYANGRLIGRSRGWSSDLPFGFPEVFRVPRGTVTIALRVRRIGWLSDLDPENGPVSGVLTVGPYQALADGMRVRWTKSLMSELPLLILAALFAVSSLHHLLLFARRRTQIEHLWFGLLALTFAMNTFASTYWIYELTASRGLATRISDLTGHLAAAFAIQFVWTFFARRISWPLRAYQLSHVAIAAFIAAWPDLRPIMTSGTIRWLYLLPLLIAAGALVVREAWRGDAEARAIAVAGMIMIAVQALELTRNVLPLRWPFDFSIAAFGFAAVIVAMNLALSWRFRRVHEELDRLRFRLEDEVTERTRDLAEARDLALAADRAKSEFLANISHEIRTPMNGVIGMAELLATSSLTAEQRKHLKAIQISGRSLLTLLNDVLDFSRLESKRLTVEHMPFEVAGVVEDSVAIMSPLAREKGLSLAFTIAENTVPALFGDQHRARQVLLNLLSNAIKFTTRGTVHVSLRSRALDDDRHEVRFSVADSGPGIAAEDLGRLFVAFQQLDGSASRPYGGAGLGLAISKRLTELMGGTLTVDSAPGRGSTFHFTIVGERATLGAPVSETPIAMTASSYRILLAEDEAINRIVILGMLEHLGYPADCVTNGLDALDVLERETYDVVLMDIQMPGLDGLDVTRRIRSGSGPQPHIIALTAHALAGDRERCLDAGMNDYLSKPLSLLTLSNALASISPPELRSSSQAG